MKKKLFLLLTLFFTPLVAEEDPCCFSSCECCPIPYEGFVQARHREANGIGYSPGYSSLDFFYASDFCSGNYGFLDARGHIFNNGKWASNLGFGYRRLHDCTDMISGYNVYWDWRDGNHQVGIGTELLWSCWDIRVNGYIPVNKKKQVVRQGFDRFEGHSAYFSKKYDLAMGGLDGSIGAQLLRCGYPGTNTLSDAILLNNVVRNSGASNAVSYSVSGGIANLQLSKTTASGGGATDINLSAPSGTLFVESPNLNLSGLQEINEGVIGTSGDIRYVEFD